jgi:hypothetical protein
VSGIFYISYILLWVLCVIQGTLLLLIYRHFGLIELSTAGSTERDGLHVGSPVPPIISISVDNEPVNWLPQAGRAYLLAFVSATCTPCMNILPTLYQLANASSELEVLLIVSGQREAAAQLTAGRTPPLSLRCVVEGGSSVYKDFLVRVTPFAFVVGPDRRVRSKGLCDTPAKLERLLTNAGITPPAHLADAPDTPALSA